MINNAAKVLIVVSLFSLLLWTIYWLIPSFEHFNNLLLGITDQYTGREWYFIPAHVGLIARFAGAALGLIGAFLVWGKVKSVLAIRKIIVVALLMEATYFVSLLPSFWSLVANFRAFNLGIAYLLQIIFAAPFIVALAIRLIAYNNRGNGSSVWKWAGIAFVGYIAALWVNSVFRWIDMLLGDGVAFLTSGLRAIGFFDAAIFMSCSVVFALIGAYGLIRQNLKLARTWISLSLIMVGLHYFIYVIYSYLVGVLNYALLVDIWAIPLLGVGLATLIGKPAVKTQKQVMWNARS